MASAVNSPTGMALRKKRAGELADKFTIAQWIRRIVRKYKRNIYSIADSICRSYLCVTVDIDGNVLAPC